MRTALFGALLAIVVAAMPLTSKPSHAMALTAPAGLNAAADALSDTQKVGKEPVYSFAQLAALLKAKEEPPAEAKPPEGPAASAPPPAEEPKPETPPAG